MSAVKIFVIAAFVVLTVVSAAGCGTSTDTQFVHSEQVSKSTFKGSWPVIPDSGVLACDSSKGDAVTFTPTGDHTTYAVNGAARLWVDKEGWANFEHIWLTSGGGQSDAPRVSRVDLSDFIQAGRKLCGDMATRANTSSTAAPTVQSTGGPSGLGPGREICQVQGDNGGTYYLLVISVKDNDLSQCDNGTALQTGIVGLLTNPNYGPNVDRRCKYGINTDTSVNAMVGVYSSGGDIDRAAAQEICAAHNGSNS
jgi:hypothetical protein